MIPLSCAHEKLYHGSATPRRLPRSLTCCVPSLAARQTRSRQECLSLVILEILELAMPDILTSIRHLCGSSSPKTRAELELELIQPHIQQNFFFLIFFFFISFEYRSLRSQTIYPHASIRGAGRIGAPPIPVKKNGCIKTKSQPKSTSEARCTRKLARHTIKNRARL